MQNINAHNENFFLSLDPCTCVLIKTRNWVEYNIFQTLIKAQYHIVYCKLSCRSIVAYTVTNAPTCVAYLFYFCYIGHVLSGISMYMTKAMTSSCVAKTWLLSFPWYEMSRRFYAKFKLLIMFVLPFDKILVCKFSVKYKK